MAQAGKYNEREDGRGYRQTPAEITNSDFIEARTALFKNSARFFNSILIFLHLTAELYSAKISRYGILNLFFSSLQFFAKQNPIRKHFSGAAA
jgi:hypothetical protein